MVNFKKKKVQLQKYRDKFIFILENSNLILVKDVRGMFQAFEESLHFFSSGETTVESNAMQMKIGFEYLFVD